jgi:hypothetical protein
MHSASTLPMSLSRPWLWLVLSGLLTVAVYWRGLSGPFLFDDSQAFIAIRNWLDGSGSLRDVVAGNTSWLTHRSFAMASFAANAALLGYDPFYFKAVNLAIHLLVGTCVYAVCQQLVARDPSMQGRSTLIAAVIAAIWLLHPLHVTTVLYSVQRMAQLSALTCLLGVWAYMHARRRINSGNPGSAPLLLFLVVPALVLIGLQAKQNAVVLPALCLAVELAYFRARRPAAVIAFFAAFLVIPAIVGTLALFLRPGLLLDDYIMYDFSPWQRLLSQSRVLCDYALQLLAPHTPSMGVFTDDYRASRGLLDPPSTAACMAILAIISGAAVALRKRMPTLFAGWFFFLAAHSVESSILPIELYYEHRNYLPSAGLFLACAAVLFQLGAAAARRGIRVGRIALVSVIGLITVLALQTQGRARVWSNALVLFSSEFKHHPESVRAIINFVGVASEVGDTSRAYEVAAERIRHAADPRVRGQTMLFRITLDCTHGRTSNPTDLIWAVSQIQTYVDMTSYHLMDRIAEKIVRGQCRGIDNRAVADALRQLANQATSQPDNSLVKTGVRNRSALLYAGAGDWDLALQQATLGWQPRAPDLDAALYVQALLVNGNLERAAAVLKEALARPGLRPDDAGQLMQIEALLNAERQSPGAYKRLMTRQAERRVN